MTVPATGHGIGLCRPDIGDEEVAAVAEVLRSGELTNGPRTAALEAAFARRHDVAEAVALANGTLALAAILIALGIEAGDEVIVPSMTFIATATAVLHAGGTPVFADVDPITFTLDPRDVARRLTPRTRAVIPVHYGGQAADMESLGALAADAGIALIEDAAQAHGGSCMGRPVGGFGTAAVFSFTPTKNITMGEGGVVTTNSSELAARLRLLRNHAQSGPYVHEAVGYNWRLTEMQAAIGEVQLRRLDDILLRKRANAKAMAVSLGDCAGLRLPVAVPGRGHTYMLYTVLVAEGRDRVMQHLQESGIEARLYFPPVHRQAPFREWSVELPVTEELARTMVSLPFHSLITSAELETMCAEIRGVLA